MSTRPDAVLMRRWLLKHGPKALPRVVAWQRLPFIELDPALWWKPTGNVSQEVDQLTWDWPLPFDQFVLWLEVPAPGLAAAPTARELGIPEEEHRFLFKTLRFAVLCSSWERVGQNPSDGMLLGTFMGMMDDEHPGHTPLMAVEAWGVVERDGGKIEAVGVALNGVISKGPAGEPVYGMCMDPEEMLRRPKSQAFVHHAKSTLEVIYVAVEKALEMMDQGPAHKVEETNLRPRTPRGSKTAKTKPWLRDDLPVIRIMTPTHAAERYGQRRIVGSSGKDRKAPRPHERRGHKRRYRDEDGNVVKEVYIRPMWVGPEQWEYEGRHYRVMGPGGEQ